MKINFEKKSIELTAAEMKNASKYNSDMYKDLLEVRKENPGFEVVCAKTKKRKKSTDMFSKLTKDDISALVKMHGTDEQKKEYEIMNPKRSDKKGDINQAPENFFAIKKWFRAEFSDKFENDDAFAQKRAEINRKTNLKVSESKCMLLNLYPDAIQQSAAN